jgi:hypothetical protein
MMEQKGQKGSPGIMATTLRSGLRAPKSRPVSMPGHRHSFEKHMLCAFCGSSAVQRDETLPAADTDNRAVPSVPVGPRRPRLRLRNYWLSLVVYLAYC